MWKCEKCKEYRFNDAKECGCKEFIIKDDYGEEYEVQAMDEKGAALKYAQEFNVDSDYSLMNETKIISIGDVKYEISAEPDVYYSANKIE